MKKYYSIAIDGPSGAGKSSLAKALAKDLGLIYVDTGAIYRTVALAVLRAGIDYKDIERISEELMKINIALRYKDGTQEMLLNGENVSFEIRKPEISIGASNVSALPIVRSFLLDMQRKMAETDNVIMDGRDIGTVVLPNADLKIYLTASAEARAKRRLLELQLKGIETNFEDVLADINFRDKQDTERETAPLRVAEGAVIVDTSEIDFEQSLAKLKKLVLETLPALIEAVTE